MNTIPDTRREAISRAVILSRILIHELHQDATHREDVRSMIGQATKNLFELSADEIDAHADLIEQGFRCSQPSCVNASRDGPRKLYNRLKPIASSEVITDKSLAMAGEGALRWAMYGDLRQDWRLTQWGDAISASDPEHVSRILASSDLMRVEGDSGSVSSRFDRLDEAFCGHERYRTQLRQKLDSTALWRFDHLSDLGFGLEDSSELSHHIPTYSPDKPQGTTLDQVDTSKISRAAWAEYPRHFRFS